jgi:hypothetical protein
MWNLTLRVSPLDGPQGRIEVWTGGDVNIVLMERPNTFGVA